MYKKRSYYMHFVLSFFSSSSDQIVVGKRMCNIAIVCASYQVGTFCNPTFRNFHRVFQHNVFANPLKQMLFTALHLLVGFCITVGRFPGIYNSSLP